MPPDSNFSSSACTFEATRYAANYPRMEEETWSRRIWEAGSILKNVYTKDTVLSVNTILNNLTVIVQNKLTEHHCVPTSHFEVNIIAYSFKTFKRPQKASKAYHSVTADQTPASVQKSTLTVPSDGQKIKSNRNCAIY